jgi:hypothetical protein
MAIEHTFIFKRGHKTKKLTPLKACREKCLDCCAWNEAEVRKCPASDCVLYPFRMGNGHKNTFKNATGDVLNALEGVV